MLLPNIDKLERFINLIMDVAAGNNQTVMAQEVVDQAKELIHFATVASDKNKNLATFVITARKTFQNKALTTKDQFAYGAAHGLDEVLHYLLE